MEDRDKKKAAREARLQIAVDIAACEKPLNSLQQKMLDAMCEADPVVKAILKTYGVETA